MKTFRRKNMFGNDEAVDRKIRRNIIIYLMFKMLFLSDYITIFGIFLRRLL